MTEEKKIKIANLVSELARVAWDCGGYAGLKDGLEGTRHFVFGIDPEEAVRIGRVSTEEAMNELLRALGLDDYQEHYYTPEEEE